MGFASGSTIADKIWKSVKPALPAKDRKRVAKAIIRAFEDADCDTMYECEDLCTTAGVNPAEDSDLF